MTVGGIDISQLVWSYLKEHATCATLRGLCFTDTTYTNPVYEAGDITPELINELVQLRRATVPSAIGKALALSVQDAGEDVVARPSDETLQYVTVRVYDRGRGYRNIRTVRDGLLGVMQSIHVPNLTTDHRRGLLDLSYAGRTGHRWDRFYNVEFEAISFTARVVHEDEEED